MKNEILAAWAAAYAEAERVGNAALAALAYSRYVRIVRGA